MAKEPNQKIVTKKHLARVERERMQSRYILIGTAIVGVLVLALIAYGILDQTVFRQTRTVAQVGDTRISYAQFSDAVKFNRFLQLRNIESYLSNSFMLQLYGSTIQQMVASLDNAQQFAQDTLDGLVDDALVAQEAKTRGISVSDEELEEELQQAFGYYAKGTPTSLPTDAPYATATYNPTQESWIPPTLTPAPTATQDPATPTVEPTATPTSGPSPTPLPTWTPFPTATPGPTATPYTLEGYQTTFEEFLAEVKPLGLNESFLRDYIRRTVLRRKLADALSEGMQRSQEYLWARHILVATQEEAVLVLERLAAGEDWNKLASELSQDTSNKDTGGDLGWFTDGAMVKEFETAAKALEIGEISQPVQTTFGYHIIQLLGRETRPMDSYAYEQAKSDKLTEFLTQLKTDKAPELFDNWQADVPAEPAVTDQIRQALANATSGQ